MPTAWQQVTLMTRRKMLALIGCTLLILCCLLAMAVATLLMATEWLDSLNWHLFGPSVESAGTGHSNQLSGTVVTQVTSRS